MKNRILILFLLLSFQNGYSQTVFKDLRSLEKRADYYYSTLAYTKAAELYSEALKKKKNKSSYDLNMKAASLYRKLGKYDDAKKCFENSIASDHRLSRKDSIEYFNTLRAVGDLKADTIFTKIYSRPILNNLFRDTLYYNIFELPFNSNQSEYCPVPLKYGLLFVSEEEDTSMVRKYNALNNGGFAHLYYSQRNGTGWASPAKLGVEMKNILHVGPVTFYDDHKKAIVNICMEGPTEPYRLELYSMDFAEGNQELKSLIPLNLNNPSYSVAHPSISKDGNTLFFISDMEGGKGGTDIYLSKNINGTWSKPVNLGDNINTAGDEKYPYLTDNVLFFSSDGRYGMGGMDIYYVDLEFKDSIVVNLGYPVNSGLDDFGFSFDKALKTSYFSSNRHSQGKEDNLFMYTENKIFLDVTLYDDLDKKSLTGYTAEIWDNEMNIPIRYIIGDSPNLLKATLRPAHEYRLVVKKDNYRNDTLLISTYGIKDYSIKISKNVFLKRRPVYYASLKLKDEQNENLAGSVIVVNNMTENTIDTIDPKKASVNIKLSGDCEYIITSKNGEKLRYIYVEKKEFKITASIPYYNLYLGAAKPSILHVRIKKCDGVESGQEFKPVVKVWDWVNRNDFNISPGPEGDFQLVVTDARLFDLFVNSKQIPFSRKETASGDYCIFFIDHK